MAQHRVTALRQIGVDERLAAVDEAPYVDARSAAHRPPDGDRQVEEQRLDEQDERNPLIVRHHAARAVEIIDGHLFVEWQVVRVPHPAEVVRVFLVVAGEMRGNPTVDGVADELFGGNDDGEDDEGG